MSETRQNKEGVYMKVHNDKNDKYHVNIYDRDPRDKDHASIHVNWDSNTGRGNIVDTTSGDKETTDISCYLTSACMKHFKKIFMINAMN